MQHSNALTFVFFNKRGILDEFWMGGLLKTLEQIFFCLFQTKKKKKYATSLFFSYIPYLIYLINHDFVFLIRMLRMIGYCSCCLL